MRFPTFLVNNEKGFATFKHLFQGYFEKAGMHLQCNTIGTEILRAVQQHPENHEDLIVRVSGYAA